MATATPKQQGTGKKNWLTTMKVYYSICAYQYGHYCCLAFAVAIRFSTVIATAPPFSVSFYYTTGLRILSLIVDIHISRIHSFHTGLQPGFPCFLLLSWRNGALGIWEITSLLRACFTCFWELDRVGKGILGIIVFVYLYCFVFAFAVDMVLADVAVAIVAGMVSGKAMGRGLVK